MKTSHEIIFGNSNDMERIDDCSIELAVFSSPYPMIEMWDAQFSQLNPKIESLLNDGQGFAAFNLMHEELEKVWIELERVLIDGGIICLNIGDATRKIGNEFQLFPNHARIMNYFIENLGFTALPSILWRKQSNKPNKFMGSGMLPSNAYVTLEHEYILILRKGRNREFYPEEKECRYASAYFWEERNQWFSDIWFDLKGRDQSLAGTNSRTRSAAYPFELAYRLINMYSILEDTVLDPFLGTGTTTLAAMVAGRNSIGYEVDSGMMTPVQDRLKDAIAFGNDYIHNRLEKHKAFVEQREAEGKPIKHHSNIYDFKVITLQETELSLPLLDQLIVRGDCRYEVQYSVGSDKIFSE
jgi:DNA modification methylase